MNLELNHLAPYLPYGLTYQTYLPIMGENGKKIPTINVLHPDDVEPLLDTGKLFDAEATIILYPLSYLEKEIEHNGEKFVPSELKIAPILRLTENEVNNLSLGVGIQTTSWMLMEKLFEWHFNVFDLPEHLWINKANV